MNKNSKCIMWPIVGLILLFSAGCTAQTLPFPDAPREALATAEPTAVRSETDQAIPQATGTNTVAVEPTAEATPEQTPTVALGEETPQPKMTDRPATATPLLEEVPQVEPDPDKPGPKQQERIAFAKRDLSERLGVEIADIEVTAYEEIVWIDGSLGCPQPGMMYTEALEDGYLIQLLVDGQAYNYHGAIGGDPFLCVNDGDKPG